MSWRTDRTTPPGWRAQRQRILQRDNHRCQLRLPGCTGTATDVDHTTPDWKLGRPAHDNELQAACSHCNQLKNTRELQARKKRRYYRGRFSA